MLKTLYILLKEWAKEEGNARESGANKCAIARRETRRNIGEAKRDVESRGEIVGKHNLKYSEGRTVFSALGNYFIIIIIFRIFNATEKKNRMTLQILMYSNTLFIGNNARRTIRTKA